LEDVGNAAGVVFVVEDEVEDALGVESRVDEEELSCDQPYYPVFADWRVFERSLRCFSTG
jgi:hypothetical protein